MDDMSKFMYEVINAWQNHFGLYTRYVGYMTKDMVKTLIVLCRYKQMDIYKMIEEGRTTISDFNKLIFKNEELGIKEFRYDESIDSILPKLMDIILDYDFSEVDEDKWNQFIEYLDYKRGKDVKAILQG